MNIAVKPEAAASVEDVYAIPLAELNPASTQRFQADTIWPVFERLRREAPVHFTPESEYGPYWSISRWEDIMAIDTNHEVFSSEPTIVLPDPDEDFTLPMFIAMGISRLDGTCTSAFMPTASSASATSRPTLASARLSTKVRAAVIPMRSRASIALRRLLMLFTSRDETTSRSVAHSRAESVRSSSPAGVSTTT